MHGRRRMWRPGERRGNEGRGVIGGQEPSKRPAQRLSHFRNGIFKYTRLNFKMAVSSGKKAEKSLNILLTDFNSGRCSGGKLRGKATDNFNRPMRSQLYQTHQILTSVKKICWKVKVEAGTPVNYRHSLLVLHVQPYSHITLCYSTCQLLFVHLKHHKIIPPLIHFP